MSPKRPASTRGLPSSSTSPTPSSSGSSKPSAKHRRTHPTTSTPPPVKLHIVEAKLDESTFSRLVSLVESRSHHHRKRHAVPSTSTLPADDEQEGSQLHMELCWDVSQADVIVTAVQMRKRLERHVDWTLAQEKHVVTPEWLFDSVKYDRAMPYNDYAALHGLHNETTRNYPDTDGSESVASPIPVGFSPTSPLTSPSSNLVAKKGIISYKARYSCFRASPLVCPNQALAEQFDVVRRSRTLEGEDISALSYARAIAAIKAYPYLITQREPSKEIPDLPYIGPKKRSMIQEYVTKGFMTESQTILASSRFHSLSAFTSIHGIGPKTARNLYSLGLRTFNDLECYYEVDKDTKDTEKVRKVVERAVNRKRDDETVQEGLMNISIQLALALRHDLTEQMTRTEVEEIHQIVVTELDHVQEGCMTTIVGGYRRGKDRCNDIDIIISHPDSRKAKDLGRRFVRRLYEQGLVTHVMHLSGFHKPETLRTSKGTIETILTVFVVPAEGTRKRIHRRLDLIFALPEVYWTAVTGWTGSTMFERDLRSWCKDNGLKFDSSGLTRRHDSKRFYPKSESELFEMLGLTWIDPTLRNADL